MEKEIVKVEILDANELAEEKVKNSLNYDLLVPEEKLKVDELVVNFDVNNANEHMNSYINKMQNVYFQEIQ